MDSLRRPTGIWGLFVTDHAALTLVGAPGAGKIGLDSANRFINRELSWLRFDERVIEEARALLERGPGTGKRVRRD